MKAPKLVLLAFAMLSVGDNSTASMAALLAMTRDLQLGWAAVEWVVNAYLLAAAVIILLGGEAADRFCARRSSSDGPRARRIPNTRPSLTARMCFAGATPSRRRQNLKNFFPG